MSKGGLTLLLLKGQGIRIGDDVEIHFKKNNSPGAKFTSFRVVAPEDKKILAIDVNGKERLPGKSPRPLRTVLDILKDAQNYLQVNDPEQYKIFKEITEVLE